MKVYSLLGGTAALVLILSFAPVAAQSFPPGTATITVPPPSNDPADRLAANLVILSKNPKDVSALIDAGRSAIAVGDYNAALTFLSRAAEFAPTNGRVRAALGSALVMLERPADALRLFNEATALGTSEVEIAGDRGLAFDLQGQNRRAQRDYELALRDREDDEVTRRLALSLGISGDRDGALRLLDPLLRRQDVTGWRARAFVLAMNGGVREAESIATTVMPSGMGDTMRPFLRRLASLNAVDRAHAVNFGTMPADPDRMAAAVPPRLIPAPELAPPVQAIREPVGSEPVSTKAPRRRPGKDSAAATSTQIADASAKPPVGPGFSEIFRQGAAASAKSASQTAPADPAALPKRVGEKLGPVDRERLPPELTTQPVGSKSAATVKVAVASPDAFNRPGDMFPARTPSAQSAETAIVKAPEPEEADQQPSPIFEVPSSVVGKPDGQPAAQTAVASRVSPPITAAPNGSEQGGQASVIVGAATSASARPATASNATGTVQTALVTTPASKAAISTNAAQAPFAQPSRGLLGLLDGIEPEPESQGVALPSETEVKLAKLAAQRKAADAANRIKAEKEKLEKAEKAKADKEAAEAASRAKRNPARTWVQVATGANEAGLGITWRRLREKAPEALKGLSASYTPFKATNRILVGPFKSGAEARSVVNALNKAGVASNMFASEAGQEILKIAAK